MKDPLKRIQRQRSWERLPREYTSFRDHVHRTGSRLRGNREQGGIIRRYNYQCARPLLLPIPVTFVFISRRVPSLVCAGAGAHREY